MSDQFSLNSRSLPLEQWDVIVAGGGPAGCAAATAAAREGARTLLLESTSCLGGMGTSGLVPAWCPFTDKERIIYGGIAERVLKETLAGMPHLPADRFDWTPIDPERLKRVYDNLVTSAGAAVRFATMVTGVETDGDGRIEALLLASKWGLTAARAKVYVDATGDGDLAAWGGAPFKKGDESGDLQPATLCFTLSNVDTYAFEHIGTIKHGKSGDAAMRAIAASEKYPEIIDHHGCNSMIGPATVGFNSGHVWDVDNTDPDSITRGLIEGRKIAAAFRDACAEFCPATFGNAFLAATGSLMGIRETRRILGEYVLTHEDFVARKAFDDEIGRNCYFIDVHHKKSEVGTDQEGHSTAVHYSKGESHGIPYRCLLPQGVANVITSGRCISTDRPVQGSTRVMPTCLVTGEAAGLAAALAAAGDVTPRDIDVADLRARLRNHGAYLP